MTAYRPLQLESVLRGSTVDVMALVQRLSEYDLNMKAILDRGGVFNDNFDGVTVSFTSSGVADTENTVPHTLGKIPTSFIVLSLDKAAAVYKGTTTFTTTNIYLKSNVASTVIKVLIF